MKRGNLTVLFWSVGFAAVAVAALFVFFPQTDGDAGVCGCACGGASHTPVPERWRISWRAELSAPSATVPCAVSNGWMVADAAGRIAYVSRTGQILWRMSFSNETFSGACALGAQVAVASESGRVFLLDVATGAEKWRLATDGRFVHAPVAGQRDSERVLWLVSQDDGRLFCLSAATGMIVWTSESTNRCDGTPTVWAGLIAYGNCDGAIYIFDAETGARKGKVDVGAEDQMAGGLLPLPDGRVVAGTRSGKLVAVDLARRVCEASAQISESEAFITPVGCFASSRFAMAVSEGDVSVWDASVSAPLKRVATFVAGAAVDALASDGKRVFARVGGTLAVFNSGGEIGRIALGDDVGALSVNGASELACVADGSLLCVKGVAP